MAVLVGLWGMGAMAVLYGLPWQLHSLAVGFAALLLTAWGAYREACLRTPVVLDWSAQGWQMSLPSDAVSSPSVPCAPTVILDFQRFLLVRVQGRSAGVRWLWCQRQDARQWHRFRCALFAARQP